MLPYRIANQAAAKARTYAAVSSCAGTLWSGLPWLLTLKTSAWRCYTGRTLAMWGL